MQQIVLPHKYANNYRNNRDLAVAFMSKLLWKHDKRGVGLLPFVIIGGFNLKRIVYTSALKEFRDSTMPGKLSNAQPTRPSRCGIRLAPDAVRMYSTRGGTSG